jgi:two-component system, chemotaxis family, sensor kinase Cph1
MSSVEVRFGEADLTTCDREPIHIPGSIQPHGVLLVIDRQRCCVDQVAGDTQSITGMGHSQIIGQPISAVLDAEATAFVTETVKSTAHFVAPSMRLGVGPMQGDARFDLTLHALGDTAIVELEPVRSASSGADDPIVQLKSMMAAVQHTANLQECCDAAATVMRALTGFDRAMVYRFLPNGSGVVIAERSNAGLESFLGLHYPASDIPKQARELYRRNWLRAIPNIDYVPAPLQPAINARTRQPIDMSHCDLRSVSPIHLEYLRNMGVCASLSASIICQGELWGMLVLHNYSPHHVSAGLRVACETFAQILSLHVEAKVYAQTSLLRTEKREIRDGLVARLSGRSDIGAVLASPDLLNYLDATGAAVCLEGQLHLVGDTPSAAQIIDLVEWLNRVTQPLFQSEHLASEYAPAANFAASASGLIAAGVSRLPRDYLLWFRPEMGLTVRWAGDPTKQMKVDRHGTRLTPRGSFTEWLEVTRMQSAPWTDVDLEAAEALRVVLLESVLKNVDVARREREFEQTRVMAEQLEIRVAQRTEQLRALAVDLDAVEDRERRQIARDLHDDLSQILAAARIRLAALCQHPVSEVAAVAAAIDSLVARANSAVRSLASQLAPDVLHELGLSPALDWLAEEVEGTYGIRVTVYDDGQPKPLPQALRSTLYRAARELLINVAKHAKTDSANVTIKRDGNQVSLQVADAGIGFDHAIEPGGRGLGLISLRERLSYMGGSMQLHTAPGKGTVAILTAPMGEADSTDARA